MVSAISVVRVCARCWWRTTIQVVTWSYNDRNSIFLSARCRIDEEPARLYRCLSRASHTLAEHDLMHRREDAELASSC